MTHYHRNGVSGVGFDCSMQDRKLTVQFNGYEPVTVNVPDVGAWGKKPGNNRKGWVSVATLEQPNCTLELYWRRYGGGWERFVAIRLPGEEGCFAAFSADLLPDLTFGVNSWHGDLEWLELRKVL